MGEAGEGQNITHQQKKMGTASIKAFRDRFDVPIPDDKLEEVPFYKPRRGQPGDEVPARARRRRWAAALPARRRKAQPLEVPALSAFEALLKGTDEREISTTMAFVRILNTIVRDKNDRQARRADRAGRVAHLRHGRHVPPARHLFPRRPALHAAGRRPAHVLQGGQERPDPAGRHQRGRARCRSWIAAATSYSTHGAPMIPFYIFYSMFGFQRVGDLAWAAGDMRARGFLLGGTAGRTTLNGEGLQHEDGHSHLLASTIPNCVSYDPTFAYELAVIIQDGLRRMYQEQEDVFYYITVMNENYAHPAMPEGARERHPARACTCCAKGEAARGSAQGAAARLRHDPARSHRRARSCWRRTSASRPTSGASPASTSCAATASRRAALEPAASRKRAAARPTSSSACKDRAGPGDRGDRLHEGRSPIRSARSCRSRTLRRARHRRLRPLGLRARQLRRFFEVDRHYVAVAALKALADEEAVPQQEGDRGDRASTASIRRSRILPRSDGVDGER